MDLTVPTLIEQIRVESEKMANSEGAAVLHAIELAKLYGVLRGSVTGRRWEKSLAELGISPRVAARYLKISESWWGTRTPGSEILALLPCDLHKLEWICRLGESELPVFVKALQCKDVSRGEVITAVQKLLGEQPGSPPRDDRVTAEQLKRVCGDRRSNGQRGRHRIGKHACRGEVCYLPFFGGSFLAFIDSRKR